MRCNWGRRITTPRSSASNPTGTPLNASSIQKAIDYIHSEGGGRLVFYVGRYLTGSINLRSNVTIQLNEGAVLLGSTNPYDYPIDSSYCALVRAVKVDNVAITGKGVIDGQGREASYNLLDQIQKGIINDPAKYDRPDGSRRARTLYFRECKDVTIDGITLKNSGDWVQTYDQCDRLKINGITVDSKAYWNNDGLDIVDCRNTTVTNSFIDATDDGICLKSHSHEHMCENIEIRNCVARSSASGIKFGTVSAGGYKNIRIINNKVYDTFRSAFTIATPDGGVVENILVDSLYAYNVGNAIFLRIGNRWTKGSVGSIDGVTIRNMYCELSDGKPDAGYEYEGPVEDLPRNISPAEHRRPERVRHPERETRKRHDRHPGRRQSLLCEGGHQREGARRDPRDGRPLSRIFAIQGAARMGLLHPPREGYRFRQREVHCQKP